MEQKTQTRRHSDLEMLSRVAGAVAGRVAATLAKEELTLDQWRVLRALVEAGPQTMSGLTRETSITGPTLSRVVDRLVERALLFRNVDADDRRRVVVHVAERGRTLVARLSPSIEEAERDGLSPLSSHEARTLRKLLERITSAS